MNYTDVIRIEIKCSSLSGRPDVIIDGRPLRESSPIYTSLDKVDWPKHFAKAYIQGHSTTKPLQISFEGPVKWFDEILAQFKEEDGKIDLKVDKVKEWNFADILTTLGAICGHRKVNLDCFTEGGYPILNIYMLGSNANATRMLNTLIGSVHIPDIPQSIKATISSTPSDYRLTVHYCKGNKATKDISELSAIGNKKGIEFISLEGTSEASVPVRLIKRKNDSTKNDLCCFFLYETGDEERLIKALEKYIHVFVFYPRVDRKVVHRILEEKGYKHDPYEIESWDNMATTEIKKWFSSFESYVVPVCYMEELITCADKAVTKEQESIEEEEKEIQKKISCCQTKLDEVKVQLEDWKGVQNVLDNEDEIQNIIEITGDQLINYTDSLLDILEPTPGLSYSCECDYDVASNSYLASRKIWDGAIHELLSQLHKMHEMREDFFRGWIGKLSILDITFQTEEIEFSSEPSYPKLKDYEVGGLLSGLGLKSPTINLDRLMKHFIECQKIDVKGIQNQLKTANSLIKASVNQALKEAKAKQTTITKNICSKEKQIDLLRAKISGLNQELLVVHQSQESIKDCMNRLSNFERAYNFGKTNN